MRKFIRWCWLLGHSRPGYYTESWIGLDDYDTTFHPTGPCRKCGYAS